MGDRAFARTAAAGIWACLLCGASGVAHADDGANDAQARLESLKRQIAEQTRRLDELRRALAQQETTVDALRRAVGAEVLSLQRGAGAAGTGAGTGTGAAPPGAAQVAQAPQQPVGQAPERDTRPPEVAPIFEQPGVLTPRGKFVLEPSLQYAYSSSNRIALVGYTIIPAIHIGVIDVREVKRNTTTATLTARYGLTNRFEVEARLPFVHRSDSSVGREIVNDQPVTAVFEADGSGIGDVEFTARYQFNDGGMDRPYYVGSLRLKTRTGKDPFEVNTTNTIVGLREGVQTELPTGSGFYSLQPALTVLYPSDPAVFFGTVSYLRNFQRSDVSALIDGQRVPQGDVKAGDILGFNFGMGLALNERSSFSIGYDHSSVGRTRRNGSVVAESVRVQLGTLLLGYSYRLNPQRTLNVSLGAGVTRDTPDVTLTVRVPVTL